MFYTTEKLAVIMDMSVVKISLEAINERNEPGAPLSRLNWGAMKDDFKKKGRLVAFDAFAVCYLDEDGHSPQRKLFDSIAYNGVRMNEREVKDGDVKGSDFDFTVPITIRALQLAPRVDHIVLGTVDKRLCPLVKELAALGVRVTCLSDYHNCHNSLRREVDEHICLTDYIAAQVK